MLNEIDFVVTGDRTKRLTHVTENGFGIIDIKWVDSTGTTQTQRFDYSSTPLGAVVDTGLPDPINTVSHIFGKRGERIKFSLYYYYNSTGRPPLPSTISSGKYRYIGKDVHPQYVLWPAREEQNPLSIRASLNFTSLRDVAMISAAAKVQRVASWKERLNILANYFDKLDNSLQWTHQSASVNNVIVAPSTTNEYSIRLDNCTRHWCKGIGIGWRAVNKHENSAYTTYGTPVGVRANRYDTTSAIVINIALGSGIDSLIDELETEYQMTEYINSETINHIRKWYYTTPYVSWAGNSYFGNRRWWFTNIESATFAGSYTLYTGADTADWDDLWDQYNLARNWK